LNTHILRASESPNQNNLFGFGGISKSALIQLRSLVDAVYLIFPSSSIVSLFLAGTRDIDEERMPMLSGVHLR
jgi:hypothetical protein